MREEGLETERMRDCKVRGDLWVSRLSAEHEADMMEGEGKERRCKYSGDRRRGEEKRPERRVVIKDGHLAVEEERKEEEKKEERGPRGIIVEGALPPRWTEAGFVSIQRLLPAIRIHTKMWQKMILHEF